LSAHVLLFLPSEKRNNTLKNILFQPKVKTFYVKW